MGRAHGGVRLQVPAGGAVEVPVAHGVVEDGGVVAGVGAVRLAAPAGQGEHAVRDQALVEVAVGVEEVERAVAVGRRFPQAVGIRVLHVAPAAEELELAGVADRLLRHGQRAQALGHRGGPEQGPQVPTRPAPQLQRLVLHGGRAGVDPAVGIHAEALYAGVGQVDAGTRRAVHPLAVGLDVVDEEGGPLRLLLGLAEVAVEDRGRHERAVQLRPPPLLVDPDEVPARGPGVLEQPDHLHHLSHVVLRDHRGHRGREAGIGQVPDAGQDLGEGARAAHGVVGGGGGAVQAHLQAQALPVLAAQAVQHRALEQDAVAEHRQLPPVGPGHTLHVVEQVPAVERFPAGEEEALHAERGAPRR